MQNLVGTAFISFDVLIAVSHMFFTELWYVGVCGVQSNLVCLSLQVQYVWAWEKDTQKVIMCQKFLYFIFECNLLSFAHKLMQ